MSILGLELGLEFELKLDLNGCRFWDGSVQNPEVFLSEDNLVRPNRHGDLSIPFGPYNANYKTLSVEPLARLSHFDISAFFQVPQIDAFLFHLKKRLFSKKGKL